MWLNLDLLPCTVTSSWIDLDLHLTASRVPGNINDRPLSGRSKGGAPLDPKFSRFLWSFWEHLTKSYIGAPPEGRRPLLQESWIRLCTVALQDVVHLNRS